MKFLSWVKKELLGLYFNAQRFPPFFRVLFSVEGLGSVKGRKLVVGKIRRISICTIPPLARYIQKQAKLQGACISCGASCKLLFQCPHWDEKSHLCTVYEHRPNVCRFFPLTAADLEDRNLVSPETKCGFQSQGTI